MADIDAGMVKKLRDMTNVSMMECKRALVDANGDIEKANKLLRERGIAVATKKATRTANQGLIASATSADGKIASLIEVNCETDFVARNSIFQTFVASLAAKACDTDTPMADAVKDQIVAKIAEIGENIIFKRNIRYVGTKPGIVQSYIHQGGKVGVIVELNCTKPETVSSPVLVELAKDLTLHVAATMPRYLKPEEVPADVLTSEKEIYAKQVVDKPAQIVDKIVEGKVRKFYEETCFINQMFVKEQKTSITALLAQKGKELNDTLSIARFTRYQLGE